MKKIRTGILFLIALLSTTFVFAADTNSAITGINTLGSIVDTFTGSVVKALITLFSAMALAAFFFGIVRFIIGMREGKEKELTDGKQFMKWSLAALFVMFSVFGLITWGQDILGIKGQTDIVIPQIKGLGGTNTNNTPYTAPSGLPVGDTSTVKSCPFGQGGTYTDSVTFTYCPGYNQANSNTTTYTCPNGRTYSDPQDKAAVCGSASSCDPAYSHYDQSGTCVPNDGYPTGSN